MPNLLRVKLGGRIVITVPLIIFMDDVSGNVSKQWNKHHVVYVSNAAMPREMLEKQFCVRFVSLSPYATPLELMQGVKASIQFVLIIDIHASTWILLTNIINRKVADNGVITWDCKYQEKVMLLPYCLFVAGDNPMQAEECSHGSLKCNYFCRTCKVGGTMANKRMDNGYTDIFKVSIGPFSGFANSMTIS